MSHDEAQRHPTGRSPHEPEEYGVFSHPSSPTDTSTGSSANPPPRNQGPLASAVAAMELQHPRALTKLENWAASASDSQLNALSGAIGGFTSGVVTCPLDVIKTKLQAQGGFVAVNKGRYVGHRKAYSGLVGTAKIIWREEGLRGMYRGLGPIILGYLPTWAVWFTVYNKSKVFLAERKVYKNQFLINFWSSIVAGASSTIVTNPIWVIKTRLMSQSATGYNRQMSMFPRSGNTPTSRPTINSPWHYNSTLDAARKMYSSEGILSFYSGLTPALLGLTHVAVQFPVYEYLRMKFTGQAMGEMGDDKESKWLGVLSASIMSKIMASSATYPHEVIRTRLQTQRRPTPGSEYLQGLGVSESTPGSQSHVLNSERNTTSLEPKYRGVIMTFRTILREEGWRAFYAGMGVNMMRAVPAATVTMMTYEFVMKNLRHAQLEGQRIKKLDETTVREP
ncbi:mitochondrial carrier [Hypoxylon sp. FL1150]|nr:mitochondrial carrier [Hypoxylon sp. FL1150]